MEAKLIVAVGVAAGLAAGVALAKLPPPTDEQKAAAAAKAEKAAAGAKAQAKALGEVQDMVAERYKKSHAGMAPKAPAK